MATTNERDWRDAAFDFVKERARDVMSGKSTEEMCQSLIETVMDASHTYPMFAVKAVNVWSVDPRRERLIRVTQGFPTTKIGIRKVIPIATSFTGAAFESRSPKLWHNLTKPQEGRAFGTPELVDEFGLQSLLSMPIRNIGNPHQVSLVLNFYFGWQLPFSLLQADTLIKEIRSVLNLFASGIESNLRESAYRASTSTAFALARIDRVTVVEASQRFADTVRNAIHADWVSVYLQTGEPIESSQKELPLAHKGDSWTKDAVLILSQMGSALDKISQKVKQVASENREYLAPDMSAEKFDEMFGERLIALQDQVESVLFVPLQDIQGSCQGVLRAVNFKKSDQTIWRRLHNYDDVAIVEAMGRAFAPLLERLVESDQRDTSLKTLAHELRVPVVALRAVHRRMEREYETNGTFKFRRPYFKEVAVYTEIMQRLMLEVELVRMGPEALELVIATTNLWTEVIIPAKRFIEPLLRERGMSTIQINDYGFQEAPRVNVDQALLTQVVFNLLDNAIKYYPKNRPATDFQCKLVCRRLGGMVSIDVTDNGNGLQENEVTELFRFSYRSESAKLADVRGSGIGLWLSRGIVRRHGGDLQLTKRSDPTTFTLSIPSQ